MADEKKGWRIEWPTEKWPTEKKAEGINGWRKKWLKEKMTGGKNGRRIKRLLSFTPDYFFCVKYPAEPALKLKAPP